MRLNGQQLTHPTQIAPVKIATPSSDWGTVSLAEVDLNQPYIGPYNLGDFHSMIPRHRPVTTPEATQTESPRAAKL